MDRLNNRLRKCLGFKTPNQLCSGCGGWIPSPLGSGQPSTPLCWENRWHATGPPGIVVSIARVPLIRSECASNQHWMPQTLG